MSDLDDRGSQRVSLMMESILWNIDRYDCGVITKDVMAAQIRQTVSTFLAKEYDMGFEDGVAAIEGEDDEDIIIIEPEEDEE